jgi:hypothetical protein
MSDALDRLIANLTQCLIVRLGLSHEDAEAAVRQLIDEERVSFEAVGSPYGHMVNRFHLVDRGLATANAHGLAAS